VVPVDEVTDVFSGAPAIWLRGIRLMPLGKSGLMAILAIKGAALEYPVCEFATGHQA